jgi:hypothetical protein
VVVLLSKLRVVAEEPSASALRLLRVWKAHSLLCVVNYVRVHGMIIYQTSVGTLVKTSGVRMSKRRCDGVRWHKSSYRVAAAFEMMSSNFLTIRGSPATGTLDGAGVYCPVV